MPSGLGALSGLHLPSSYQTSFSVKGRVSTRKWRAFIFQHVYRKCFKCLQWWWSLFCGTFCLDCPHIIPWTQELVVFQSHLNMKVPFLQVIGGEPARTSSSNSLMLSMQKDFWAIYWLKMRWSKMGLHAFVLMETERAEPAVRSVSASLLDAL